jgi:nucleotide-binding universal stress UspA family protein
VTYLSRILSSRNTPIDLFHVKGETPEAMFDLGGGDAPAYKAEIGAWTRHRAAHIQAFMENARKVFLEAGFAPEAVSITIQPRQTGIARDIIDRSNRGCAAVVVGRQGFGTLPEFMLGSIASKLAETITHVPLAIVGGQPETDRVVVAFDDSPCIRKGFDQVIHLLDRKVAEILLCHIVRPLSVPHSVPRPFFSPGSEAHWLDENSRKIIPAMMAAKEQLNRNGFDPEVFRTAILKEKTSRAEGITRQAGDPGFGTIMVGRRGATTVASFSMGRVTRKILQMAYQKAIWIL